MGIKTTARWGRALVDVCTQRDFLDSGAILQVVNRAALIENLERLFGWVRATGLGVVSSVESHRPTDMLNGFPLHCIDDTPGQSKIPFTLLENRLLVEADNSLSLPPDLCANYQQIIFRKRSRDVLGNPKADRFLSALPAAEFILCGVGLERAIKSLALGLLARHQRVTVVIDACGFWSQADAELAARQLAAKGIRLISTENLTAEPETAPIRRARGRSASPRNRHRPLRAGYKQERTAPGAGSRR